MPASPELGGLSRGGQTLVASRLLFRGRGPGPISPARGERDQGACRLGWHHDSCLRAGPQTPSAPLVGKLDQGACRPGWHHGPCRGANHRHLGSPGAGQDERRHWSGLLVLKPLAAGLPGVRGSREPTRSRVPLTQWIYAPQAVQADGPAACCQACVPGWGSWFSSGFGLPAPW